MPETGVANQKVADSTQYFSGNVAVITGAGSGIGRALALQLAEQGALLAINDRSSEALAETRREIEDRGGTVLCHAFDVGSWTEMQAFADAVHTHYGRVDAVINNAGVALGQMNVEDVSIENFEWIVKVNMWGVFYGSMAFLPLLRHRPKAHLVNVCSVFGFLAIPGQAPYCATKFAVRGFTDALNLELMDTNVAVTLVCPSQVKTNIVRNGRHKDESTKANLIQFFDKKTTNISPEDAARIILEGVARKERRILVGRHTRLFDLAARFMPHAIMKMVARRKLKKFERALSSAGESLPQEA